MTMIYPSDTGRCCACNTPLTHAQHIGLYLVSSRAAIGYRLFGAWGTPSGAHSRLSWPVVIARSILGVL
jgi:hypothetical protein